MKVRDGDGKHLLKRAVDGAAAPRPRLPPKQGFGAPVAEWFRGELGRARAGARSAARRWPSAGCSTTTQSTGCAPPIAAGRDWSIQLWNLYNVSAWYDHWVARTRR